MSKNSEQTPSSQPKKLSLDDFVPEKARVETSLGALYVRHAYASDWKHFNSDDPVELGRAAIRQLANRSEDKKEDGPLAEEDIEALSDGDFEVLAPIIAKRSDWGALPAGPALQGLGLALKAAIEQERKRHKKWLDDMRRSIGGSYGFLDKSTLEKLQDQVTGLADIRKSLSRTGAISDAMRSAGLADGALNNSFASTRAIKDAMRDVTGASIPISITTPPIELPRIYTPPRPEETPVGRATIESAQNSRDVAEKVDTLAAVVGGLNQTLVTDVLPSWFRQVEHDQASAKDSLDQAARGLWWTKWAVIVSVVVTILATWWQVWVARDIDRENSAQQQRVETLLREQLAVQQKLIEQQARDGAQLRGLLEQQRRHSKK